MIDIGTNWAPDASSGGALEGWNPREASVIATDCAPFTELTGTAGTAGVPPDGGGVALATAVVGAEAGALDVSAVAGAEAVLSLPEETPEDVSAGCASLEDDFEPVSTSCTASGAGAAPGGGAAVSAPALSASAL